MDVQRAIQNYVHKLVTDPHIVGMKVLLLDSVTMQVVSMVYSQSEILEKEVYLVERLGNTLEPMNHLKAAVFVQPTAENVDRLRRELAEPKFSEFHIFFSNIVPQPVLQKLAEADEHDAVRQVQEYYGDYMAVNSDLFSLNIPDALVLNTPSPSHADPFNRSVRGILSVLLSLKRKPSQIRYQATSDVTHRLADAVARQIREDEIFDFRRQEGPLLLILDRKDDPVTPLLSQWTYQAMVHELLGLNNNRVVLKNAPGVRKDLEEVVLSSVQDEFFRDNRFANFGDLGVAVKDMLDNYQRQAHLNDNIESLEDMQNFLERYPAFRSQSINVSKHVALMGELARLVDSFSLMDVSQLEQELACSDDQSAQFRELTDKIRDRSFKDTDKLRLCMLYALRYEDGGQVGLLKSRLADAGVRQDKIALIDALLQYAGSGRRSGGLYGGRGLMSNIRSALSTSLQGVSNVYAQHVPLLTTTIEAALRGKLKDSVHPPTMRASVGARDRPQDIIVYIHGGVTFEEALKVAEMNRQQGAIRILLGGSCVHNSTSFLEELDRNFAGYAASGRK